MFYVCTIFSFSTWKSLELGRSMGAFGGMSNWTPHLCQSGCSVVWTARLSLFTIWQTIVSCKFLPRTPCIHFWTRESVMIYSWDGQPWPAEFGWMSPQGRCFCCITVQFYTMLKYTTAVSRTPFGLNIHLSASSWGISLGSYFWYFWLLSFKAALKRCQNRPQFLWRPLQNPASIEKTQ